MSPDVSIQRATKALQKGTGSYEHAEKNHARGQSKVKGSGCSTVLCKGRQGDRLVFAYIHTEQWKNRQQTTNRVVPYLLGHGAAGWVMEWGSRDLYDFTRFSF